MTATPKAGATAQTATCTALVADDALPAARFLTGPDASDVLRVPIAAAGGRLHSARIRHVQYRTLWWAEVIAKVVVIARSRRGRELMNELGMSGVLVGVESPSRYEAVAGAEVAA